MSVPTTLGNYNRRTRDAVLGWFGGDSPVDRIDFIAQDAFEQAKTCISAELSEKDHAELFSNRYFSAQDFTTTLLEARSKYESQRNSKAYKWLEKLSSRVAYYGVVLDVLVQHHPEYVSLAWGAFKFLFLAVLNHEEMVKNLAKACSLIADSLPRADLSLILYPTPAMRETVARLYAMIMKFIVRALRWYRRRTVTHILSSIVNPWSLDFGQELGEIEQHARGIDELAQSASRAEIRESHYQIHQTRSDLEAARGEIKQLTKIVEDGVKQMTQFALESRSIQSRMSNDVSSCREMICYVHLDQILTLSFMESLPTSGQCLAYCRSFWLRRQGLRQHRQIPDTSALQKWNEEQGLAFVVTEDINRIHAKDILVDIINLLRGQGLPVLWALRPPNLQDSSLTSLDVIRILLYQALQINTPTLNEAHPITIAHLREASSHEEWLLLLKRALQRLPTVYIVFDSELVDHVTDGNRAVATKFLMDFAKFLGPDKAKLIVSSQCFEARYAEQDLGASAVVVLKTNGLRGNVRALRRQRARTARQKRR
ncbi:hypothetical protein F4677DRAFT_408614 [Hypoxylon crocopeplum]|nr:hypothetical protein F4677DRAFT_408614 [Hypoxylon crocopeplum]